jgi:predicted dienelactone hydrolase
MRLFEILMFVLILPVLLWPLLSWRRPRWIDFLPGTAVLLMIIQLLVEGYRWQMLPLYALVVVLFLLTLPRLRSTSSREKERSGWAIAGSLLGLLVWLAALALAYLLPVPQLPGVTGPYAIGTQTFHLLDESRDEIYTDDPSDKREIMIQVWYPAEADAVGETADYLQDLDVMGSVLAERLGLPSFLLDHVNLVEVDAYKDVPLLAADAPYPVLVFSHGLRGFRGQNTAMARELVSRGFVVLTIDHTYGNVITVFPDGRIVLYNPEVLSGKGQPPRTSNILVTTWADDIGFALDQLAAWNETDGNEFASSLDLSKVGIFGHSTGGGATVQFCARDERCQAAVGLDAWLKPVSDEILAAGLAEPFLFLRADQWVSNDSNDNFAIAESLLAGSQEAAYLATIAGADHFDFSDLPLFSPLTPQLGLSSTMDSEYVVEMMTSMTSAFFRQELKGEGDDLVSGAMVYPEMSLVGNGR